MAPAEIFGIQNKSRKSENPEKRRIEEDM